MTVVVYVVVATLSVAAAQEAQSPCYGGGSIATAVVLTAVLSLVAVAALLYFLHRRRRQMIKGSHLILESDPEKGPKSDFAFDNPGFKDATLVSEKPPKWTPWAPLAALAARPEKKRALDDSVLENCEVKVVALKSRDFTGLGFSVCGNMKDGIYVRDVLHRGPAFESGKLVAGDRIRSVTISFEHMVYEDALAILSYASPYEVMVEAKSGGGGGGHGPSGTPRHPVYRNASCTDLYHITKSARGEDYSSGSNYSSLQKSMGGPAALPDRLESKSPRSKARKPDPEEVVTAAQVQTAAKPPPAHPGVDGSPKIEEQNENNLNLEADDADAAEDRPQPRKRERKSAEFERGDSDIERDKNGVPREIPDYLAEAANAARSNRKVAESEKKGKGPAPAPPPEREPAYHSDSDEEAGNLSSVNTIELNPGDVTVHQSEDEERKTASTGDLSKLKPARSKTGALERAQSLDIADASGANLVKKKIYDETENLIIDKEPRLSVILDGLNTCQRNRLKTSAEWGDLEDVILNDRRRRSEPQFDALLDLANQIKRETPEETVTNAIWPDESEIRGVTVLASEPKRRFVFGGKKSRQRVPHRDPGDEPVGDESAPCKLIRDEWEIEESPPRSPTLVEEVMDGIGNVPDETKHVGDAKTATDAFLHHERTRYEHDTNVPDDLKVSRHATVTSHVVVAENGGSNLHSLEFSVNEPGELYVAAIDDVGVADAAPEEDVRPARDVVEIVESTFSRLEVDGPEKTYVTEIQVLTAPGRDEAVSNGDHLESAFENYVKNFESRLENFESNMQNFENNLEEFIREEPRPIIADEEPSEIEKQVSKIQEMAEEQLKRLPEMRFSTSSYEGGGRKTPEKRHSFELLRSNFERRDSTATTPPKSRIPIATTAKTPPMSPERRDSRNLDNENERAILELMSTSTPFASKIKPPKNVTVTSIRNNSKIPSGLPTPSGRPPIAPRKHDAASDAVQISTNGSAESGFKQWVFNPANVTNVTVGKDK
ncbi:uncharacterized protein LOC132707908 [Cylas formicarius]|uniref:uncharacterized protein LOC132707908 n=1 Tax=Cylas formicarius TaxID=197179 RepID=UPI002958BD0F|nr:uncharacterized protein LOC132707908 [Cylas formicarius]